MNCSTGLAARNCSSDGDQRCASGYQMDLQVRGKLAASRTYEVIGQVSKRELVALLQSTESQSTHEEVRRPSESPQVQVRPVSNAQRLESACC